MFSCFFLCVYFHAFLALKGKVGEGEGGKQCWWLLACVSVYWVWSCIRPDVFCCVPSCDVELWKSRFKNREWAFVEYWKWQQMCGTLGRKHNETCALHFLQNLQNCTDMALHPTHPPPPPPFCEKERKRKYTETPRKEEAQDGLVKKGGRWPTGDLWARL